MKQHVKWLYKELEKWENTGVLTKEQGNQLRRQYGFLPKSTMSWGRIMTLLGGIGLSVLGIILLFAGYWYGFSPNGRFDVTLALLVMAILAVGFAVGKVKPASFLAEAITTIYMLILTVSTLLVADTYYTGEYIGLYLLIILLCSLPIIYLLDSAVGMILYLSGVVVWSFSNHALNIWVGPPAVGALLIGGFPYYIRRFGKRKSWQDPLLMWVSWAFVGAVFGEVFFTLSTFQSHMNLYFIAFLSSTTYALGCLEKRDALWTLPFKGIGALGLLYTVVQGTFISTWIRISEMGIGPWTWILIIVTLLFSGFLLSRLVKAKRIEMCIGAFPFILFFCHMAVTLGTTPIVTSILFNVYILIATLVTFVRGTVIKKMSFINGSIITLIAMFGARFFDPTFTFVERGVSFLLLGVLILVVNAIYLWRKQRKQGQMDMRVKRAMEEVVEIDEDTAPVEVSQEVISIEDIEKAVEEGDRK